MKISVADCLELNAFREAAVAAGKGNLGNEVKGISMLDSGSVEDVELQQINEKEMLCTGFLGVKDDPAKQCRMIKAIAAKGCAALALFYVGKGVASLDESVAAAAEEAGLPLIIMPENAVCGKTVMDVSDRLLYGENFKNSLISNTIFHLLNFEKHSNFQSAVKEAAINNDFQMVLLSTDFNPILTVETRHVITVAEAVRMGREMKAQNGQQPVTFIDIKGVLTYWGPVSIGDEQFFMLIVDNEDAYTAGEIRKLAEVIELAMGMWKYTPERDARSEFLKAMIRGNKSLVHTLQEEAKIRDRDVLSVFYTTGQDQEEAEKLFSDFEVANALEIIKVVEEEEIYGMILNPDENASRQHDRSCCMELFGKLEENEEAFVYHVTGVDGVDGAADGLRLINESGAFVQSVFPFERVFSKYELTLVNTCISIQIQGGPVKKNYLELLDPFKEAGESKGRYMLETLETFVLDAGMSSSKTAELMEIHTNTVQYRLKRINELLGVEVTGNRVVPGLIMALALKRIERTLS